MKPSNNDGASSVATATNNDGAASSSNKPDNPDDETLTQNAMNLIQQLQDDFVAQEKKTCRDCLRSKTLPCSRVVKVANGAVFSSPSTASTQILTKTHELLIHQASKLGALPNVDPQRSSSLSSLECMKWISGGLRFIQLILLLSERQSSQFPSEAHINNMMVSLVKAWANGVCELTRSCNTNNESDAMTLDAAQTLHAGPIFCFAFYSLLRMNEYVQTRGALMVPLWKGLCELAKLLGSDNAHWRNSLPPTLLGDAIRVLGDFLQEGKGRLECEALQYCNETPAPTARIAFQGKLVGFMMARMGQLLAIHFSNSDDPIPNGVWRSLLGLRGLAATLQLLSSSGTVPRQSLEPSFLKVYCEIAAKAGKCVLDTMLSKQNETRKQVRLPALENFLQSTMVTPGMEFGEDDEYHPHQDYRPETKSMLIRVSGLARTIGKVSVLQQFLELCNSNALENIQALLAAIEHLHSVAVPQCLSACLIVVRTKSHHSFSTTPTTIVLGSLRVMVNTLQEIENPAEFMASPEKDAFYRLLLRWLAGNTNNDTASVDSGLQEHPLSRELVVALLHAHIVGCSEETKRQRPEQLLSLMAKLLFDARTKLSFRRNIAAVLVRVVQSSSSTSILATKRIQTEFVSWLNCSAHSLKKRKRSGKLAALRLQQDDILVIARVLGTKRESAIVLPDCQQVLRKEYTRLSSDCAKETPQRCLLDSADRNTLLLAWLEGSIATSSTSCVASMLQMTGLDLVVDVLRPCLVVVSGLRFQLGTDGDRTHLLQRKVMLYSASMRLFVVWSIAFGDDGQLPIDKACLLIKHSISKDPWQQPDAKNVLVEKQHSILKFEVLHLLGHIAKAVPSNGSEKVLKSIRRAFIYFLSSNDWSVISSGISSVVQFASDLNAAHQGILPLCLPPSSMGVFQKRASGQHGNQEPSFECVEQLHGQLHRCRSTTPSIQTILACHKTTTSIAPGSYVLEMPTQDDRTATVIFPPGEQSLQDIQYMLGSETQIPTQTLKRAVVTSNGAFKLLLVQNKMNS